MKRALLLTILFAAAPIVTRAYAADLLLRLGPEELVQAGGADISVLGYSVPSLADWDNDGLNDLIVGEGSGSYAGKVRVYINTGAASEPQFSAYFYAQANGADLTCPGSGCLGCFPRVVYWDDDVKKDLLIGLADGKVKLFLNIGTDENPAFDAGTFLQVGPPGSKANIGVGARATPSAVDWNSDGKKDLVVGALDAKIHLFINEGTDTAPDFRVQTFAQANGSDLLVPPSRSSPDVLDLDGDAKKDILTGNYNGELFFYSNTGSDAEPNFAGYESVESDGVPIDLAGTPRSRPFVCDWTGDGYPDVLIGAGDGKIHLYQSIPQPGDTDKDYDVEGDDFAAFALYWGATDCGYCSGADFFDDDKIDMLDVLTLAQHWLEGCE
ncbi:MAG TPA: VCBS repeat-containing protein [Sedimentisphaerales bacterium]|nr:VCBS repeat-containing protein [Sedimentisphaerales bacterium]